MELPKKKLKQLAKFITEHRETLGLSINGLARKAGLDPATVWHLEQATYSTPQPITLQKLARGLEVDFEDLYALAGYDAPERLPEFAPYLRAKYNLSEAAVKELHRYFEELTRPGEKKGGHRGKSHH